MKLSYRFDSRLMAEWTADGLANDTKGILDRYGTDLNIHVFRERSWCNSTYGIKLSDPIFLE